VNASPVEISLGNTNKHFISWVGFSLPSQGKPGIFLDLQPYFHSNTREGLKPQNQNKVQFGASNYSIGTLEKKSIL
jgi:hypothetical protein